MGNKPIVHAPIATGSTEPRDIRDRFADFVNLKDFGAAGDGITDDSTAWAAWRTALQNGGMPYIPAGDYLLGDEIIHAPKGHLGRNINSFSYEDDGVVLDEFSSSIYVDHTNGDDSNDGLSQTTAVKTISKALDIITAPPQAKFNIYLAGGTYTESLDIHGIVAKFILLDDVEINGAIAIRANAYIIFTGEGEFTINTTDETSLDVDAGAVCWFNCVVNINHNNSNSGANRVVYVRSNAYLAFWNDVTVYNTYYISKLFHVVEGALLRFSGNFTNSSGTGGCGIVFQLDKSGKLSISTGLPKKTYKFDAGVDFSVLNGSSVDISGSLDINAKATSRVFDAYFGSFIFISSVSGTITCTATNADSVFRATCLSGICISDVTSVVVNGSVTNAVAVAYHKSLLFFTASTAFSGSITGKRYDAWNLSFISVANRGANAIPGSVAGVVGANSYSLYL